MLSYEKAFKLANNHGTKIYLLLGRGATYTNMKNGGYIDTRTIDKLCAALGCQPGDLMEYIPDAPTGADE